MNFLEAMTVQSGRVSVKLLPGYSQPKKRDFKIVIILSHRFCVIFKLPFCKWALHMFNDKLLLQEWAMLINFY